jgi:hypothetical protein
MPAHISSVSSSTHATPAAASQAPAAKPKNTEKPAGQSFAQDSVKISSAGRVASQAKSPQK